jgi:hypothetical protein
VYVIGHDHEGLAGSAMVLQTALQNLDYDAPCSFRIQKSASLVGGKRDEMTAVWCVDDFSLGHTSLPVVPPGRNDPGNK